MDIEKIDKNMRAEAKISENGIFYYDVREDPFDLYGFYQPKTESVFRRVPDDVARETSESVYDLAKCTAGGRVRFSTDSEFVAIRAKMPCVCRMSHMAMTGSAGFDLCIGDPSDGSERIWRPFSLSMEMKDEYSSRVRFGEKKMRYITIEFPNYSHVTDLEIGVSEGATLAHGLKYREIAPIVYYGSSITQGACACRPGNAYQNIICRKNRIDFLNLGFSGSGRAEEPIVNYMATLPMSAFVADYDHNAPNHDYLYETSVRMYRAIRAEHPDIPYLFIARPDTDSETEEHTLLRRESLRRVYEEAIAAGDRRVSFLDGAVFFREIEPGLCTVDGTHPNDLGFYRMAEVIGAELDRMMKKDYRP